MKALIVLLFASLGLLVPNVQAIRVVDSNTRSNVHDDYGVPNLLDYVDGFGDLGQCFSIPGDRNYHLRNVQFRVTNQGGNPSGTVQALLYDTTGAYGSSCVPTGSALATSHSLQIGADPGVITLTFGPPFLTLQAGRSYAVSLRLLVCVCGTYDWWYISMNQPSNHPGNMYIGPTWNGTGRSYVGTNLVDIYFVVNGDPTRVFRQ